MVEPLPTCHSSPCFLLSLASSFRYVSVTKSQERFHRAGRGLRDERLQPLHFWRRGNGGPDKGRALYQVTTPPACHRAEMRTHFLFLLIHQSLHHLCLMSPKVSTSQRLSLGCLFFGCSEITSFLLENWRIWALNKSQSTLTEYWLWAQHCSSAEDETTPTTTHPSLVIPDSMQHVDLSLPSPILLTWSLDYWPLPLDYKLSESRSPLSVFVFSAFYALFHKSAWYLLDAPWTSVEWMNE